MNSKKSNIDYSMIMIVLGFVTVVISYILIFPDRSKKMIDLISSYILSNLGFVYVLIVLISLFLCIYMGVGSFGSIRLGDEKKEYSEFAWAAMMFCSSMAAGFIYWGSIEWVFHYMKPPFGIIPLSVEAAEYAATIPLFYWGFSPWAIYMIPAVAYAFLRYNLKKERFDVSIACEPLLGKYADGFAGKIINILFLFGIIGGTGTALGIGSPLVSASIQHLFGLNDTPILRFWVIVVVTIIFTISAYNGMKKGIQFLSNANIILMLLMVIFTFLVGNKGFIVKMQMTSLGMLLDNYFKMSTYLDPVNGGGSESWLVFYWAWWLAYAIFMGLFIARISKGRTIRQVIIGGMAYGFAGSFSMFSVLGNYSMDLHLRGIIDVVKGVTENGGPATVIELYSKMPLGTVFIATILITSIFSMATSFDSAAYIMAMVSSKKVDLSGKPDKRLTIFWSMTMAALPMVIMMFNGSLAHVQALTVILAFPTCVIYIIIVISCFKMLSEYKRQSS
ncbi:BCCT family transporter [Alkalibaculum sp. M08DMB]|uniref:BCCT family transporter n=1 Tax=Alkalibaculum sporogenes TaxID=2655001 RepID=A0A6A7K499_9FIRM|nr:BCCT family transporter [Alkalibaculum sporogenes]MPW24282.1 BCCT family transporter [Alkalibaculum sporogenes]